jgi:hypothetical protein
MGNPVVMGRMDWMVNMEGMVWMENPDGMEGMV